MLRRLVLMLSVAAAAGGLLPDSVKEQVKDGLKEKIKENLLSGQPGRPGTELPASDYFELQSQRPPPLASFMNAIKTTLSSLAATFTP